MEKWKVQICDDDDTMHELTSFVLSKFQFRKKDLHLIHAYNQEECLDLLKEHPDTAVIILDMIMESDDTGLRILRQIKEELPECLVRVILRSGNSDDQLTMKVMEEYDISAFREKTELTSSKLNIALQSALGNYQRLQDLKNERDYLRMKLKEAQANPNVLQELEL